MGGHGVDRAEEISARITASASRFAVLKGISLEVVREELRGPDGGERFRQEHVDEHHRLFRSSFFGGIRFEGPKSVGCRRITRRLRNRMIGLCSRFNLLPRMMAMENVQLLLDVHQRQSL